MDAESNLITVESLEKEGWEDTTGNNSMARVYRKGKIEVFIGKETGTWIMSESYVKAKGVSTLQDLLTLDRLVNGPITK